MQDLQPEEEEDFFHIITINEIITLNSVVLLSKDRLYTIRSTTKKKSHRSTNILS